MSGFKELPCKFTTSALEEIKTIVASKNIPVGYGLRVGIKGGGCSGISYMFGFDTPQSSDEVYEWEGMKVLIEKKHFMYIAGLQIDFEDGAHARGFIFENPDTKFN